MEGLISSLTQSSACVGELTDPFKVGFSLLNYQLNNNAMSLHSARMSTLANKLDEQAQIVEEKVEKEEKKDLKRSVIIKKKSKKNNE